MLSGRLGRSRRGVGAATPDRRVGATVLIPRKVPTRLTRNVRSNSARLKLRISPRHSMPALLTKVVIWPKALCALATNTVQDCSQETSCSTKTTLLPASIPMVNRSAMEKMLAIQPPIRRPASAGQLFSLSYTAMETSSSMAQYSSSASAGGMLPMGSSRRRLLNQSTHPAWHFHGF